MISIVIPTLNEARFLPDCLRSLRNQDYAAEYEVIVADNGSTDESVNIARSFGVKVVSCPEKKSVFYARRMGAGAASGDIIVQADADTIYPRDWLKKLVGRLAAHPEAVAVAGRFVYRDPTLWAKAEYYLRNTINKLTARLFGTPLLVSGATFAFRRRAFLRAGGYEGIDYSADQYGIASRLSQTGKVLYDKDICVLTSSRSVQKPTIILLRDVLVHIKRLVTYLAASRTLNLKLWFAKTRSRPVAAGLFSTGLVIVLVAAYGYFIPASPVFGKVYYKVNTLEKVVALTFDDGPNEPYTSEILDILNSYNVKATFFAIGKNVELYPEVARRIVAEGHVIANHSYSHGANHALTPYGARDVARAQRSIFMVVGVTPHLYRPPHGKKSPWELAQVRKEGLIEVNWAVSTKELTGKPAAYMAADIVKKTDPGEIILLHDGYGTEHHTARADKSVTVRTLPLLIEMLQSRGYQFVTVPELLGVPAYNH